MLRKKDKKEKTNSSNNNDNKSESTKGKRKGLFWKLLFGGIIIVIIIAILCGVLIPRTSDVVVQATPTTKQYLIDTKQDTNTTNLNNLKDDVILQTSPTNYLVIGKLNLEDATISPQVETATKTTYLCYLPNSPLGKMQFMFSIYHNSNGPTGFQVGNGDLIDISKLPPDVTSGNIVQSWIQYFNQNQNYTDANLLQYIYLRSPSWSFPSYSFNWGVFFEALMLVVFILLIIGTFWISSKGSAGLMGSDLFSIGKSQATQTKTNVKFSDVGGIGEEKYELEEIVDFLKRPKKYAAMGARIPKGVILYGPPGTGKTLLAKAVAGEANVPFFQTSGSSFEDMLVGVGAKRIRDLFSKAKKVAPAIIFIDEIDAVAGKRSNNRIGDSNLANQTVDQLLAEMDGFTTDKGVIVIAATNRLDMLDEAILRPGRFDRQIPINLPDIGERVEILKIHARNKNLSSKVSLEDVARRTPGFSGAQLENILNEAALLAVRKNNVVISMEDMDEAIDRVVAGPAKHTRKTTFEERKQIAFHEGGHALVGLYTKGSDVVEKITIIPRGKAAGYTIQTPSVQEMQIQTKTDLLGLIASTLGGRASEEINFGIDNISTGASNDLYKATNIAKAMVTQLGMTDLGLMQYVASEGEKNPYRVEYSEKSAQLIDSKIEAILQERYEFAKKTIKENQHELQLIVESLLILETINRPQILYIHENKKLPDDVVARIHYLVDTHQLDERYLFDEEKKEFLPNSDQSNNHQDEKDHHDDENKNNNDNKDNQDKPE